MTCFSLSRCFLYLLAFDAYDATWDDVQKSTSRHLIVIFLVFTWLYHHRCHRLIQPPNHSSTWVTCHHTEDRFAALGCSQFDCFDMFWPEHPFVMFISIPIGFRSVSWDFEQNVPIREDFKKTSRFENVKKCSPISNVRLSSLNRFSCHLFPVQLSVVFETEIKLNSVQRYEPGRNAAGESLGRWFQKPWTNFLTEAPQFAQGSPRANDFDAQQFKLNAMNKTSGQLSLTHDL